MENDYTIKQEIEHLGIESHHFRTFYCKLKETKQLPPQNIVPGKQYNSIVDYLKTNHVLGKDREVLGEGLRLFENRRDEEHYREVHGVINRLKENQDAKYKLPVRQWRKF